MLGDAAELTRSTSSSKNVGDAGGELTVTA